MKMDGNEDIGEMKGGPSCGHIGEFNRLKIAIVTVSTTRSDSTDKSGKIIAEMIESEGHENAVQKVVKDDYEEISSYIKNLVDKEDIDLIITTGGTGATPDDVTVEAISPMIEKELPGFGELFRQLSYEEIGPLSIASRSMAGIAKYTPIFCLPGSSNAVKLGVGKIILPVCGHTVEQARRGKK